MANNLASDAPSSALPVSRQSLAWLLAIQFFIVAPHFVTAPLWLAAVWLLVAVWRWRIFQGAWNYPSKIQKTLLVAICCFGLVLSLGASFRFESMVSLLLVGFILKLLELKNTKDFILLIFIALFILAAQFIEFNHFLAAFYGFACLVLLCATLMQLYKHSASTSIWQTLRPSLYILLQAIPFMLMLFVVMPRIGSFWAVPSPQHAKTGMSDSMSPGDFTELMESDELAFRVAFMGASPSREKLYWRSLVFSAFDGRRWSQSHAQKTDKFVDAVTKKTRANIEYQGDKFEYDVIAEASNQPWLYSLAAPVTWTGDLGLVGDMRLQAFSPVTERMHYHLESALSYQLHEISVDELAQNTSLPKYGNPKTRERAQEWLAETGDTEKLIEKVFGYFHQSFFYTLKPPPLGADVVDDFLWNSRQGFCEHFASSFVFFMRAANVPARVVVGYQGGDINSIDGSLSVRQRDAHAWAEVWLAGRGWVRFDPTAAVAPDRVLKGIEQSLSATDRHYLAKPFGSSIKLLLRMREQWDAANLNWTRWVLNYDSNTQESLLQRVLGDASPLRIAALLLAVMIGLGVLLVWMLLATRRRLALPQTTLIYVQLCRKLKACGFNPLAGETPQHFTERVILARPDLAASLSELIGLYEQLAYQEDTAALTSLQKALSQFRPRRK